MKCFSKPVKNFAVVVVHPYVIIQDNQENQKQFQELLEDSYIPMLVLDIDLMGDTIFPKTPLLLCL